MIKKILFTSCLYFCYQNFIYATENNIDQNKNDVPALEIFSESKTPKKIPFLKISDIKQRKNKEDFNSVKKQAIEDANNSIFTGKSIIEKQLDEKPKAPDEILSGEADLDNKIILSLEDCVKIALENNPQIRSAFSNSEIYKTKIGQAWANYFPKFTMTNGYTKNRSLVLNFAIPQKVYNYYNAMDLSSSLLLFDFGKTKALADMHKETYNASVANLNETINTIIYNVKSSYYDVLYALEKEKVYQESVGNYELQLKQAESFYTIGTKPKIDVTIAEYNLGNAQLGLIQARNEVILAFAKLNNSMGLPYNNLYIISDNLQVKEYSYEFSNLIDCAYHFRPELLAHKKQAKASEMLVRSAKRSFLPDIEAVGAFLAGGGAKFSDDYGWKYGAQFRYTNTNMWLLKKQLEEAKATHQKNLADLDVAEQNMILQVKQAYINVKNANESIPVVALSLKHAKEQYRLASGRYKAGIGDAIELKDSELTYRNARLDYLSALLDYNISIADLERVIGSKLQEKDINGKKS